MSITTFRKNLIDSDMIKIKKGYMGFNPTTGEENEYIELEEFLKGIVSKPLSYYGNSIANAVNGLIEQGYGKIEIPGRGQTPVCYITVRLTSENEVKVNLVTFGYRAPMRNSRYYSKK